MASIGSKVFYHLLRFIKKKKFLEMQFAFGKFDFYNSKEPPKEIYKACNVQKRQVQGRNIFTLSPTDKVSTSHILYLHGGGYVQNFVRQHWRFMLMLVQQTNCTITAPDYPLAPEFTHANAFEMLLPLYEEMITSGSSDNKHLIGDSAGGGLALALAQEIKLKRLPRPHHIILLSPWLDITLTNPAIKEIDRFDPFLSVKGLRRAGLAYAGPVDPTNSMLSPINGELEDIGNISIFIGTRDILLADARKLKRIANDRGIRINYREYADMVHAWMFLSFPEAKRAQKEIFDLVINKETAKDQLKIA
jgi:acetyl esterase/lipase